MSIITSGMTDIGRKRSSNQDSIYSNNDIHLYIVADGMGGHQGGDIASKLAVKNICEYTLGNLNQAPRTLLKDSIKLANKNIYEYSKKEPSLQGMGTTVVALYFFESYLNLACAGDSRAYLVHQRMLFQLSKDHSLVQEKMNLGIYTRDDAMKDKAKNVLVRTVGYEENVDADIFTYKVGRNDIFLICSDGLHSKVSDHDILFTINQYIPQPVQATEEDLQLTVTSLVQLANENGGQDNISVILCLAK